jgi:hypothetical protein
MQQPNQPVTTAPAPPPPPAAPAAPVAQEAVNVAAIRAMRSELSRQITSATNRRNELAERLRNAEPEERPGLEARIQVLDDRIVQLERDLAETGKQLTANPAALVASTARPPAQLVWGAFSPNQATGITVVFTVFVLAPIALAAAWLMLKRARVPARKPLPPETVQRLERIEQSVDAIAIEVERVTEGQRFLTRLLTDKAPASLPAPQRDREPLHAETIHTPGKGSD